MENQPNPYVKKKSRWKIIAGIVGVTIALAVGIFLVLQKKEKTEVFIGKVVQIGDGEIGIVKEFKPQKYIILIPLGKTKSKFSYIAVDKNTVIRFLADSLDEYNKQQVSKKVPDLITQSENQTRDSKTEKSDSEKLDSGKTDVNIKDSLTPNTSEQSILEKDEIEKGKDKLEENKELKTYSEEMREKGLEEFEKAMIVLSKKANDIDIEWRRYKDACLGHYTSVYQFGRDWFGIWDGFVSIDNTTLPECRKMYSDIVRLTEEIKSGMKAAIYRARKNSLYPGDVRSLRKKYFMEWEGWDKE